MTTDNMHVWDGGNLPRNHRIHTDVVIVGSGAGGATVAAELAAAGVDVVILEEGGYYTGRSFTGDAQESFDTVYRNGGMTGTLGRPPIVVPLGRCVGGTTTVNSATCFRTPDFVLQRWERDLGLAGATELSPHYDTIEADLEIKPVPDATYGPANGKVEAACKELGWAGRRIPRNESGCLGTGVCALGCPSDGKQAMSVSKIPAALSDGAQLWVRARVERVLRHGTQIVGVAAHCSDADGTPTELVVTAKLVVMAAGAFHTPALLLGNGIDGPWMGRNLHMHPATRLVGVFDENIKGWSEVPQAYNIDEFIPDGVFIQGQFVPPDVQAPVIPGWGHVHKERMATFPNMASFGALVSDTTAGRVRTAGRGKISPLATYSLNRTDFGRLRLGIARTAEALLAAGARQVFTGMATRPVVTTTRQARTLEHERCHKNQVEMMAFHPMGTARAGAAHTSVCDPWGRVYGYDGLAIVDGCLLPTSNKINPQLTIMALAHRAANRWIRDGIDGRPEAAV